MKIINQLRPLALLPLLLSSACSTHTTPPQQSAPAPLHQVADLQAWNLSGAMSAKNAQGSWSASLYWQQEGINQYQLRLLGPLGSGSATLEKRQGRVTYREGGHIFSSTDAESLLRQHTGIVLPVNALYYWVRGIPAPGAVQSTQYDASNRLVSFQQKGYRIEYAGHTTTRYGALPRKIRIERADVLIKLAIQRWVV